DVNSEVAGWLRDLAFLQKAPQSRWGYKRAAAAVLALPVQIDTLINPDGTLQKIPAIGPASTRVILEVVREATSPTVERALEAADARTRSDIVRRRGLRGNFLSRAAAEAAMRSRKPNAPSRADIKCDLQMHSDWSDGSQTLEDIVQTGLSRAYTHAAVTDHSYGLPIAGGLSMERVHAQHQQIDALNARYRGQFRLLKGIEANIRADGSVDMSYDELALMDVVVAAPHSALRGAHDQTARMLGAVQTPGVHILGHPRGRMYGSRPGVSADWEKVFAAAARAGVAIELDGDPSRQDLDFDLARRAVANGCLFAIDSDAHATDQWWYAETALAHARLAGVPRSRVINCWPLDQLLDWANERKSPSRVA
ncbi:MAG TPA: PHP domain-containing protein, partial [Vicinamibacterales bacterium]|nr:PHP domain-containing protein [Vicinamibacterales bacterium]